MQTRSSAIEGHVRAIGCDPSRTNETNDGAVSLLATVCDDGLRPAHQTAWETKKPRKSFIRSGAGGIWPLWTTISSQVSRWRSDPTKAHSHRICEAVIPFATALRARAATQTVAVPLDCLISLLTMFILLPVQCTPRGSADRPLAVAAHRALSCSPRHDRAARVDHITIMMFLDTQVLKIFSESPSSQGNGLVQSI